MSLSAARPRPCFPSSTSIILRLILAVLAGCALAGCGDTLKGKAIAEPEIALFHTRLNEKRFNEIYETADADFRKATSPQNVVALFSAIDRKLGTAKSWTTKTWTTRTINFVTRTVFVVDTVFEKGTATETFTFKVSGSSATLVGYQINSLDMLIK